jgi:CheY-like chemotaxis protein
MSEKRILVVDDEFGMRMLVRACLGRTGAYEVVEARSGEEALELAAQSVFELILMDIRMPGIGGLEACRQLKASEATRGIPVVFVSAWSSLQDQLAAEEAGASGFIPKPFGLRELLQAIGQYV